MMKKLVGITFVAVLALSAPSFAQDSKVEKGAKSAWTSTKKAGKAVGNKSAELAVKGSSHVTNKKSDKWIGSEGQTIFVDDGNKYYWVNGNGKRIYVSESALKAKNR